MPGGMGCSVFGKTQFIWNTLYHCHVLRASKGGNWPVFDFCNQFLQVNSYITGRLKLTKQQWDHLPLYGFNEENYRVFIKNCVFSLKCCDFSELCQFCCSAGFLPAEGKQRKARVQNIFRKFGKKHNI